MIIDIGSARLLHLREGRAACRNAQHLEASSQTKLRMLLNYLESAQAPFSSLPVINFFDIST